MDWSATDARGACIDTRCASLLQTKLPAGTPASLKRRNDDSRGRLPARRTRRRESLPFLIEQAADSATSTGPGWMLRCGKEGRRAGRFLPGVRRRVGGPASQVAKLIANGLHSCGFGRRIRRRVFLVSFLRERERRARRKGSYLVDPASSHMLVSKIKPCMSKYKLLYTVKLRMAH